MLIRMKIKTGWSFIHPAYYVFKTQTIYLTWIVNQRNIKTILIHEILHDTLNKHQGESTSRALDNIHRGDLFKLPKYSKGIKKECKNIQNTIQEIENKYGICMCPWKY